jgi:hypothetical protein
LKRTWVVVSTAALVVALVSGAKWFVDTHRSLSLDFGPVPRSAPTLTQSALETLLADDYTVVRRVRQIPSLLKESFTNVTGLPFDMNNPGDPMSTDVIIHAPSRQLIFAAVGKQSAIVVYEQGGFASFPCAVVLSKAGSAAWIAIDDYRPMDILAVRRSVHEARFKRMAPGA